MAGAPVANDRKRGADFRRLALDYGIKFWEVASEAEKKELFFKLAPNLIPRLNEHTGADGADLFPKPLLAGQSNVQDNYSIKEVITTEAAD